MTHSSWWQLSYLVINFRLAGTFPFILSLFSLFALCSYGVCIQWQSGIHSKHKHREFLVRILHVQHIPFDGHNRYHNYAALKCFGVLKNQHRIVTGCNHQKTLVELHHTRSTNIFAGSKENLIYLQDFTRYDTTLPLSTNNFFNNDYVARFHLKISTSKQRAKQTAHTMLQTSCSRYI